MKGYNYDRELYPLLDSSLILTTLPKSCNIKLVECGSYIQLYCFENPIIKKINKKDMFIYKKDDELELKKKTINSFFESKKQLEEYKLKTSNEIELKNIMRSKLQCQRIAKSNMEEWKSFITLTFKENIDSVKEANKKFRYFVDKVQRVKKDFKYLCITEFQKRGAIHYHLLTNIECGSKIIPEQPIKRLYNQDTKDYKELKYYDIKYWNEGFSSAEPLINDPKKVVGYISKYMTKDIDNRLFNRHRYFYSRNLNVPNISYIDLENIKEYKFLIKKIQDKQIIYQNEYLNPYDSSNVSYLELQ